MRLFFRAVWLRTRLAWAALCGRQLAAYAALLDGKPVGSRLRVYGTLEAGDGAVLQDCIVRRDDGRGDAFRVGSNCFVIGCTVGYSGHGFSLEPDDDAYYESLSQ